MTKTLDARLLALESLGSGDHLKPLPEVVDNDTTDAELGRLRKHGRSVMRYSEFLELC